MALKINIPKELTELNVDIDNVYLVYGGISEKYENNIKTGKVYLPIYLNELSRKNGGIPIAKFEILIKDEEIINEKAGYVHQLNNKDISDKPKKDVYKKIKTLKILSKGKIIDLSDSIDC